MYLWGWEKGSEEERKCESVEGAGAFEPLASSIVESETRSMRANGNRDDAIKGFVKHNNLGSRSRNGVTAQARFVQPFRGIVL